MSEQSDAVILVVSEETGAISLAYDAKLYYDLSPKEIQRKLRELLDRGVRGSEQQGEVPALEGEDMFVKR
jgi:diadenylate cyclase